jgi:hypothetical protein
MAFTLLLTLELFQYALNPLLMLQQHRHHNRLKRPRPREHDAGLHMPLGAVKEPIEECLVGFWQSPSEGRPPAKAGQHILYLFGELCRLANRLPAHLMATATRVWEHEAFLWERLNGRFLSFIQMLRNESASFPTGIREVLAMCAPATFLLKQLTKRRHGFAHSLNLRYSTAISVLLI